jgi:hypothetical protein
LWALAYKNEIKTDSIPAALYAWYQQGSLKSWSGFGQALEKL